ncbi:hypothetical protein VULLAG_LOCUS21986 [Vulpes lagopus]
MGQARPRCGAALTVGPSAPPEVRGGGAALSQLPAVRVLSPAQEDGGKLGCWLPGRGPLVQDGDGHSDPGRQDQRGSPGCPTRTPRRPACC